MKRLILLITILLPLSTYAQIPEIEQLGKEAKRQRGVEHESVGSFMLGMASTFADKSQRATFEMLDNIEMITCTNDAYSPTLKRRIMAIIASIGAEYLTTTNDKRGENEVYAKIKSNIVRELIILTTGKDGGFAIVAMSGEIPTERLDEIAKLSPPNK